jgi:penicillin-binding protein A
VAAYRAAEQAAWVRSRRASALGGEHDGAIPFAADVRTAHFGTLRGAILLPVSGTGRTAGVDWNPSLRLPGLRRGERVRRRVGRAPQRAAILAADGTRLDATALGASIAGQPAPKPTGLERLYNDRLSGHPSEQLLFGARVIARSPMLPGRSLQTTISPRLMAAAATALGQQLGGIAVIRPRDGAVQALVGLAVTAPQPPRSTFKIITAAAALQSRIATPSSTYPVRTSATLSGVTLRNASGEACGGSLTEAFTVSCNSVFAPLGAKLGAPAAGRDGARVRSTSSQRSRRPSQARSRPRPSCATSSPSAPQRSARTATSQHHFRWPASARRSRSTGTGCSHESPRSARSTPRGSCRRQSPTRCEP